MTCASVLLVYIIIIIICALVEKFQLSTTSPAVIFIATLQAELHVAIAATHQRPHEAPSSSRESYATRNKQHRDSYTVQLSLSPNPNV